MELQDTLCEPQKSNSAAEKKKRDWKSHLSSVLKSPLRSLGLFQETWSV